MVKTSDNTKRNFFLFQYIVHATIVHSFDQIRACLLFTVHRARQKEENVNMRRFALACFLFMLSSCR